MEKILDINNYYFNFLALPMGVFCLLILFLGLYVFLVNRSRLGAAFLILCISISVWQAGFLLRNSTLDVQTAYFYSLFIVPFIPMAPFSLYVFTGIYLKVINKKDEIFLLISGVLMFLVYISSIFTDLFIVDVKKTYWGWSGSYSGYLSYLFIGIFVLVIIVNLFNFLRNRKRVISPLERKRRRILFVSICIGYLGTIDFVSVYGKDLYQIGYLPLFVMIVILTYAVTRYGLLIFSPAMAAEKIMYAMGDALIAINWEGKVEFVNKASLDLLGYKKEELIDKPVNKILLKKESLDPEKWGELLKDKSFKGKNWYLVSKNKEKIIVNVSIAHLKFAGEILGTVFVAKDMRLFNEVYDELKEQNDNLEKVKKDLNKKVKELQTFNKLAINRELRMVNLKKEIDKLRKK